MTDVTATRVGRSEELMARAARLFPGGVNSPVRAFRSVGGTPRIIERAAGARLWDVDGNEYVDYVGSWGPMILGHAHPAVVAAVQEAAARGTSYGAPNPLEVELAEEIVAAMPSIERLRFVNSGTEAAMSALRVARGFTGRPKIIKLAGGYHGHADGLLVRAGSGASGIGRPTSAGVTEATAADTLVAPYNDVDAIAQVLEDHAGRVAALIVEPVAANMGVVPPADGYLAGLRRLTADAGTLLIFDEVITGFRVARGGAQALYGVMPDLTVLGKIIGGGMPVGAYGGRADVMAVVAPDGPVYQAGTLSGNPLAMAAGLATLRALTDSVYKALENYGARLEKELSQRIEGFGVLARIVRVGSLLTVFFEDDARFARFFHDMLDRGVYLPPSQQEAWFISAAHGESELEQTLDAAFMALGAELRDKLDEQLERWRAEDSSRPPLPAELTPEIVSALDGEDLEMAVLEVVAANIDPGSEGWLERLDRLPKEVQIAYATAVVEAEVLNGGFNQLFYNEALLVPTAVDGYQAIGAGDLAAIVRESFERAIAKSAELGWAWEPRTLQSFMDSYDLAIFDDLDDRFVALGAEERGRALRADFIHSNAQKFFVG